MVVEYRASEDTNRVYVSTTLMLRELECRHCGLITLSPRFVTAHDMLRKELGKPIVWHSGFRCKVHQKEIYDDINRRRQALGLAPVSIPWNSYHIRGEAGDTMTVQVPEEEKAEKEMLKLLAGCGFNGIGVQREQRDEKTGRILKVGFTHLDVRLGKFSLWYYGAGREDG